MLITNATLITWESPNRLLADHALLVEGGLIRELGPSAELTARHPGEETLDARGQLVMPGNICAHTHFYGAFARGMAIPGEAPENFKQILERLWWPLDKSLDEEAVRYSALVCLVDAIKHGTTTLIDHHASPNAIDGSLDVIEEAVVHAGLRACLCYEVTDRDGPEKARAGIRENVRFIKKRHPSLVTGTFGLHAPLTLSNATLEECRAAAPEGTGYHIHVSESDDDGFSMYENDTGIGWPVDWLYHHEILGPRTIVAHAVHVDEREMDYLSESQTWVTHQPRSNMNNAVGVAQVEQMLEKGIKVCLGNDGFSNAMWEEWKTTYLLHKIHNLDPRRMNGMTVTEMAVYNNAALANVFFPSAPIGQLVPGAFADLIFVDYQSPTELTAGNLPWHILFGFQSDLVTTTIVAGKVLMKDRQLLTLDEKEIAAKAREEAAKVWKRYNAQFS
ncbi:MAG: putative aminohydrolase SsnA [Chloroflexota bacterium]